MKEAPRGAHAATAETSRAEQVLRRLGELRVLPVATLNADIAQDTGRALGKAGLPCIEITFRAVGAAEAIGRARARRRTPRRGRDGPHARAGARGDLACER